MISEVSTWLDTLFGDGGAADCHTTVSADRRICVFHTAPTPANEFFVSPDAAAERITAINERGDVWAGCALFGTADSRKAANAVAIPGFWADVDYQDTVAHKGKAYPPDEAAARALLDGLPLAPSVILHSGHGLQAWWLFKELWIFSDDAERQRAAEMSEGWQAVMRERAAPCALDSTYDLPRVLRVPGTVNRKGSPVPVRIIEQNETRYDPSDFLAWAAVAAPRTGRVASPPRARDPARHNDTTTAANAATPGLRLCADAAPPFEKFQALQEDKGFEKLWNGKKQYESASERDLAAASFALHGGWPDQDAADLLIAVRRKFNDDVGKTLRQDYIQGTIDAARRSLPVDLGTADPLGVVSALLGVTVVAARQMGREEPTFEIDVQEDGGLRRVHLGTPENILSGAKLQATMLGERVMIRRYKTPMLEKLGTALLAVAVVVELPSNAAMLTEHLHRFATTRRARDRRTKDPSWFLHDESGIFTAEGKIEQDSVTYPRVYLRISVFETFMRDSGKFWAGTKYLSKTLREAGFTHITFQGRKTTRALWRSPEHFIEAFTAEGEAADTE